MIILLQWHLSRGGIYYAASEQSVLEVDVLDAGEMGRSKDLSNFDNGQIVMARASLKWQGLWGAPG